MINFNGNLTETPQFSVQNRAILYGDGVFETVRVNQGNILFLEDHYFRLMASMRILRMEIPDTFTLEFFQEQILLTISSNQLDQNASARVRFTVYRNDGGKYLPVDNNVTFFAEAKILPAPFYTFNTADYEVELYKDHYLNADLLSTLKTTNRIINITGSIFAQENNYANCLLINNNKAIVEALNGNLFVVNGSVIKTPPLEDGCIRGILRKQLIDIIEKLDQYTLVIESVSPFELQKADELFITNAILGIQPISKYRKKNYENKVAKDLLGKLNAKVRLGN